MKMRGQERQRPLPSKFMIHNHLPIRRYVTCAADQIIPRLINDAVPTAEMTWEDGHYW
jgi:hypothetical protein